MESEPGNKTRARKVTLFSRVLLACGLSLGLLVGCQDVGRVLDPFNALGFAKPPIRVGVTTLDLTPPFMLPKWELLRLALANHLQEPVQFELLTPRQIRVHLGTGRLKFALLRPQDYAQVAPAQTCEILGVPINAKGQSYRQGLIVVSAKSSVHSLSEVKSRRFHFMPHGDLLNDAALGALLEAGIEGADVDKGIPLPILDTHHISSLEVAKSVVLEEGANAAGVIDEADYNKWPDKGGSFLLLSPSKDQVRVLGKTVRIPEGPFVVSVNTPPELKKKAIDFLFNVAPKNHKLALLALNCKGFAQPVEPKAYEPFGKIHRKLHPPKTEPPSSRDADAATQPSTDSPSNGS